jgi:2-keto-4-pentenoate hydratase/2-oxohepta-3-ene-1,7-dioic acid hydratase in catechol pathway
MCTYKLIIISNLPASRTTMQRKKTTAHTHTHTYTQTPTMQAQRSNKIKKFYKFICKNEKKIRWTIKLGDEKCTVGDQVYAVKEEFIESAMYNKNFIVEDNILESNVSTVNKILPPCSIQPTIFGIGLNYQKHAEEVGLKIPNFPIYFMKNPSSICGHEDTIVIPSVCSPNEVDYEVELAVILSKDAKNVQKEDVNEYILGYTVCNDVSARRWQGLKKGGGQWNRAKSFDTFCPLGPCLVTNIGNANNLNINTKVNNVTLQKSNTNDLIFNVQEIISFLSEGTTLPKGSIILTGTPEGVGFSRNPPIGLKEGDVVKVEVENIGILSNTVKNET